MPRLFKQVSVLALLLTTLSSQLQAKVTLDVFFSPNRHH